MKIIKYFLFLFLILVIAGAIYIATKESDYHIEETLLIDAPKEVVFDEVNDFKNWEDWSPWTSETDKAIINYTEKTKGEGAEFSWKNDQTNHGNIKTLQAIPYSSLDMQTEFELQFGETNSDMYWNFDETEDSTKITWGIQGKQSFMEKLSFAFSSESFSERTRTHLILGFDNLKQVVLKKMEAYSINVDGTTRHGGGYYMYTSTSSRFSQIEDRMENMFRDISNYMQNNNITQSGNPFILYHERDEKNRTAIFSAGIFTPNQIITPSDSSILNKQLPEQKVVKTTLKGDYKNIQKAWDSAYAYIKENGLELAEDAKAFEVFMTNPEEVVNPANRITQIYIPVE